MSSYILGPKTFLAGAALEARRRVKISAGTVTVPPQVVVAGAGEPHIGVTEYAVGIGEPVAVKLANQPGTFLVQCAVGAAIVSGTRLYGAADGRVAATPVSGAPSIGIAMQPGVDGQIIEMAPVFDPVLAA